MDKQQKQHFKNLLLYLKEQLEKSLQETSESIKPVTLDQQAVGRVSRIDAIQLQQMQIAAAQRTKLRLTQIVSALERLNNDEYGFCANCEEEISIERLTARPESPLCISCAKG